MSTIHVRAGEGHRHRMIDGTPYDLGPGDLVVFPAGMPATFELAGESARFLAITTGHGAGRFFEDFAKAVPAGEPPQVDAIASVTQRHGVAMTGA